LPNELPKRPRETDKQLGVTFPQRGKSGAMKNKVVFITHSGTTHITEAFKTRKPLPATHINGKAMNTKTKPKK
jgi:hypothetical protein